MNKTNAVPHYIEGSIPPAQLWIGNHEALINNAIIWLQKTLCLHNGCSSCTTCQAIRMHQHHAIIWLAPDKQYTLDSIKIISHTVAFALEPGTHFFFIIQKADALTPTCSNSLLKSIEEPPPGYHFLLLTERPQELLPTIRSRCVEHSWFSDTNQVKHPLLFSFFTASSSVTPALFLKELDHLKIHERESIELLDQLLAHWISVSTQALITQDTKQYNYAQRIITLLTEAIIMPPMPGSSNVFWKNLYLLFSITTLR